jgi:hypothetical protein
MANATVLNGESGALIRSRDFSMLPHRGQLIQKRLTFSWWSVGRVELICTITSGSARRCSSLQYTHVAIQRIFLQRSNNAAASSYREKERNAAIDTRQIVLSEEHLKKKKRKKEKSKNGDAARIVMKMKTAGNR